MSKNVFNRYLVGLACTFAGAWLTDLTSSMLPLALGASVSLMCTAPLVRQIWARKRNRKQ
ncbi:MAG: hypothetical protein ABI887_01090 [Burkholderiales bacterium]